MGELTNARRDMFLRMIEAEEHGQRIKPDPFLLRPDECRECGNVLRFSPQGQAMACEHCRPRACRKCGHRMEVQEQRAGRFLLECVKCRYTITCCSTAQTALARERTA